MERASGGEFWSCGGGERVVGTKDMFAFNEIWAQDEINILVGTLLG